MTAANFHKEVFVEVIDEGASTREMVHWLRGEPKNKVIAVTVLVNRLTGLQIPLYLKKEAMLARLLKVKEKVLWAAIDQIFEDDEPCEDDEDDQSNSDEELDEEEDDQD
jgi:hypothetical protein